VVGLTLPFVLLLATEGVLRLSGLGGHAPMLRRVGPVEGGTLVVADQGGAIPWFFASPTRAGNNEQHAFLDPKPAGTVRIFFVGASVIQGYPQPRHLASSAFLQEMLEDAWPDRRVEVINLGATAIASFPVLNILTEALDYEPDLVVIHTGHNEFFGAYGVASASRAGNRPWMLPVTRWVQSLALVQGWQLFIHSGRQEVNDTLMEAMMGQQHIGPQDKRREAAARNLHSNVSAMLKRCQAAGIPALVCTQPCNERDLAPVGLDRLNHLSSSVQQEITEALAQAASTHSTNAARAEALLRQVIAQAPEHARAHWLLGRALVAQGKWESASETLIRARDLDTLPWRAPTSSGDAVLRAAEEHAIPICDLTAAFRRASSDGLIGWELMDDHVHPTLAGQALMAETLLDSLSELGGAVHLSSEARARVAPRNEYALRLGANLYDRYATAHSIRLLFGAPFLRENNPGAYERFKGLTAQIDSQIAPEVHTVLREWQATRPFAGARCPVTAAVAQFVLKQEDYEEARRLFEIALRAVPPYTSWHLEYSYYQLYCTQKLQDGLNESDLQRAREAIEQGEFLCRHVPSAQGFSERFTGFLYLLCRDYAGAIPYLHAARSKVSGLDRLAVDQALMLCLVQTGRLDLAQQLARQAGAQAGEYAPAYAALLEKLEAMVEASIHTPPSNAPDP
jgi:lysophospholipase L1-like esterase